MRYIALLLTFVTLLVAGCACQSERQTDVVIEATLPHIVDKTTISPILENRITPVWTTEDGKPLETQEYENQESPQMEKRSCG